MNKFTEKNSSSTEDILGKNLFSVGIIKDSKLNNCLRQTSDGLVVEKCPVTQDNYKKEHLFKFKKNEVLNLSEDKCITKDYKGDLNFSVKETYENGQSNCAKINLVNVFKIKEKGTSSCIANNLLSPTTLDCESSNWTYNFSP